MDIDADTVQLLAELGLIAGDYGMTEQAEAIAAALGELRPESEQPSIIHAYSRIWAKDVAGAESILRDQALKKNPGSVEAKAVLGLALHIAGKSAERDRVLDEVLAAGGASGAVEIAQMLKGAPAPA